MPAKGKHRRPKTSPITRGFLAAGTSGAAIAIPLMGATGAHAAGKTAPVATSSHTAVTAAAAPAAFRAPHKPAAAPTTYSVVAGDYLSKIAEEHNVRGGWKKLYADNREQVGDNPSLIHPGLKLTLGAKSKATAPEKWKHSKKSQHRSATKTAAKAASKTAAKAASTTAAKASTDSGPAKSAPQTSSSGFTTPVDGATVITPYHLAGSMWSSGYHTGVDFAASTGTTVKAVGPGTVVSAGWGGAYGNEVVIQHSDGTYSQYAHLSSLAVSAGQSVSGGQQIGLSGSTGNSTGPHLHFEIRTGPSYGSDIDPLAYLRQHGVTV
ncbi:peptidase M23-like protein [Streptomyces sp. SLBN-118]|uniref:M23 family metallopeptidase n=1 Tax=Streptomyces sp. SLBN-118 TaxID=2768454 RepID=UPI00114EDB7E|nr:LysM peptidoglycan-binding domain-containing M23 family metallopeptidase [Streptomyces sp. SLBN-118]TQK50692.1 peptidase M23-like protein [Streptomyces sp. SLBN-118]